MELTKFASDEREARWGELKAERKSMKVYAAVSVCLCWRLNYCLRL
jgi:hypothetical protein